MVLASNVACAGNILILKTFHTLGSHILGFCLALAPIGVAVALTGSIPWPLVLLSCGTMFWTAGFDVIYALQDVSFDRSVGLFSLAASMSYQRARAWSASFQFMALTFWSALGWVQEAGLVYYLGLSIIACFFFWQQWTIRHDLRRINAAFFTANASVSVLFLCVSVLNVILG